MYFVRCCSLSSPCPVSCPASVTQQEQLHIYISFIGIKSMYKFTLKLAFLKYKSVTKSITFVGLGYFFLLFYQLLHPLSQKLFFLRMLPFFSLELCLIGLRSALYFLTSKIILTSGCCKSRLLFLHCTFPPGQPGVTSQQLR